MNYTVTQRILINLTQMLCQIWFGWVKGEQTYADESTSAFVFRTQKLRWMNWINWIFSDPNHCREAYASELNGTQNAPEYRINQGETLWPQHHSIHFSTTSPPAQSTLIRTLSR